MSFWMIIRNQDETVDVTDSVVDVEDGMCMNRSGTEVRCCLLAGMSGDGGRSRYRRGWIVDQVSLG